MCICFVFFFFYVDVYVRVYVAVYSICYQFGDNKLCLASPPS